MSEKNESTGIRLLHKGQSGLMHALFGMTGLIIILLVVQIFFIVATFIWFSKWLPHIYGASYLFAIIMVLYLINSEMDATSKITWLLIMMIMPIFGGLLYLFTQTEFWHKTFKKHLEVLLNHSKKYAPDNPVTINNLKKDSPEVSNLAYYLDQVSNFPVYQNTDVTFFSLGEYKFAEMLKQLEKAKHYIFLEYFIIEEGLMWGKILEILARKAKEGVEVRVMYDGTCELSTLPHNYPKKLRTLGIQCKVFSPISFLVSTYFNYRDHRKILVIDGKVAFTGGVNLADEYINKKVKHGHWKDTAIMLEGEAVRSFTLMFLQLWNLNVKDPDFDTYLSKDRPDDPQKGGYVIPYGDSPLDNEKVGESVYMDILNQANDYVHIMSPYLILDGELETALCFAAQRGVEVKLILPGIPDKLAPYALAKTHYAHLLKAGVKIYEYTPGFVHAKIFVSDDDKGVVGTINLDYRSLYHHFECASFLYKVPAIKEIEKDYQETLTKCRIVTVESIKNEKWYLKLLGGVMKVVAPLM